MTSAWNQTFEKRTCTRKVLTRLSCPNSHPKSRPKTSIATLVATITSFDNYIEEIHCTTEDRIFIMQYNIAPTHQPFWASRSILTKKQTQNNRHFCHAKKRSVLFGCILFISRCSTCLFSSAVQKVTSLVKKWQPTLNFTLFQKNCKLLWVKLFQNKACTTLPM